MLDGLEVSDTVSNPGGGHICQMSHDQCSRHVLNVMVALQGNLTTSDKGLAPTGRLQHDVAAVEVGSTGDFAPSTKPEHLRPQPSRYSPHVGIFLVEHCKVRIRLVAKDVELCFGVCFE